MDGTSAAKEAAGCGGGVGISGGDGMGEGVKSVRSEGPGCADAAGVRGKIGGPTFVVIETATVIGVVTCAAPVAGGADDTSTNRAVLWRFVSGGGGA